MTDLDKWQLRPITVWLEFRTAQTERDSPSGKKGLIVFTVLMRRWLNKLKQEKRNGTFICSAAGARSPPIGFLDDSLLLKRVIYVPLSSLSRGDGWSGSLILAGSRGLYLWWHINWALPVKKRKATVPTGPALFAEPQKMVLFGRRSFWLFIYTPEGFKTACFLSLCARLYARYVVFARLCTGQLYGSRLHVGDNDLGDGGRVAAENGWVWRFPQLTCLLSFHVVSCPLHPLLITFIYTSFYNSLRPLHGSLRRREKRAFVFPSLFHLRSDMTLACACVQPSAWQFLN